MKYNNVRVILGHALLLTTYNSILGTIGCGLTSNYELISILRCAGAVILQHAATMIANSSTDRYNI